MKRWIPAFPAASINAISVSGEWAGVVEMTASWPLKASSNSCSGYESATLTTPIPGAKVAPDDWRERTVTSKSGLFRNAGSTDGPSLSEALRCLVDDRQFNELLLTPTSTMFFNGGGMTGMLRPSVNRSSSAGSLAKFEARIGVSLRAYRACFPLQTDSWMSFFSDLRKAWRRRDWLITLLCIFPATNNWDITTQVRNIRVTVPRAFMDYWSSSDNLETVLMSEIYMHTGVYPDLKLDELLPS